MKKLITILAIAITLVSCTNDETMEQSTECGCTEYRELKKASQTVWMPQPQFIPIDRPDLKCWDDNKVIESYNFWNNGIEYDYRAIIRCK